MSLSSMITGAHAQTVVAGSSSTLRSRGGVPSSSRFIIRRDIRVPAASPVVGNRAIAKVTGGVGVRVRRTSATRISASSSWSSSSTSSQFRTRDDDDDGVGVVNARPRGRGIFDPLLNVNVFGSSDNNNDGHGASETRSKAPWWRASAAALAIVAVMLAAPLDAQAARSAGRMGGGSFRSAPSMSRSYASPGSSSSAGVMLGGAGYGSRGMAAPGVGVATPMRSVIMPMPMVGGFGYGFGAPMMMFGGGGGIISLAMFVPLLHRLHQGDPGVQRGTASRGGRPDRSLVRGSQKRFESGRVFFPFLLFLLNPMNVVETLHRINVLVVTMCSI